MRLLSFRNLLKNENSRKVFGFDIYGKFPKTFELESDNQFIEKFENAGDFGISKKEF